MILLILSNGMDRRVLDADVLGVPFSRLLPTQLQSIELIETYRVDGVAAFIECQRAIAAGGPGVDVLVMDADVWLPVESMRRLRGALSDKKGAVKIVCSDSASAEPGGEAEILGCFLPAAIAKSILLRSDPAGAIRDSAQFADSLPSSEKLDMRDLNPAELPIRVGSLIELAMAERRILHARASDALRLGVRIRDPNTVAIRGQLVCGAGVEIDVNVIIEGRVSLGDGVKVGANSILVDATIGAHCVVNPFSLIDGAVIGTNGFIGPFGRIRPGSTIGDSVQIGCFVEIKKSEIGTGSRINHLAFVGDATLGNGVTLGAGTITCNHDGAETQRTQIDANAYVGSGSQLVAPVRIGENAVIGAGSTITRDAPAGQLTVARSRQVTVARWKRRSSRSDAR